MKRRTHPLFRTLNWPLVFGLFLAMLLVACGSAAAPASEPAAPAPVVAESTPVPQPEAVAAPAEIVGAKDSITIVMAGTRQR